MPSFPHELVVELFKNRPELACELLAHAGVTVTGDRAELASPDLSDLTPTEYRADSVTVIRDRDGAAGTAIVIEVQLRVDRAKLWSWPAYVANLRARLECPTALLVVTRDDDVARWARQPIDLGFESRIQPIVIGPADVPRITDVDAAIRAPELAVLSALAHPELAVAAAAITALDRSSPHLAEIYWDSILSALPTTIQTLLETPMIKDYQFKSRFFREYVGKPREEARRQGLEEGRTEGRAEGRTEGRAEGRAEGRTEGRAEGRTEGRAEARAEALDELRALAIALAIAKLGALDPADEQAIRSLADPRSIGAVTVALGQATTVDEARTVLARVPR